MNVPVLVDFGRLVRPLQNTGPGAGKAGSGLCAALQARQNQHQEEQQLAAMFGIRSIPTCVPDGGQPWTALLVPARRANRAFLDKHLPSADELQADTLDEQAHDALASATPRVRWSNCSMPS